MKPPPDPHYRHRFPAEVISHAVWLYHAFSLSFREVELLLAERSIVVSYETVRRWCKKFGESFADCLRRCRPRPGDKWHLDEVFIRIQSVQHYLWRAVDQDSVVLDILVQPRRDAKAAKRFFRRLLRGLQYVPRGHCQLNRFRNELAQFLFNLSSVSDPRRRGERTKIATAATVAS